MFENNNNLIKWKRKYNTIGTVSKSNRTIVKRGKIDILTYKYMTTHFPGLVQALKKSGGVTLFYSKPPLFVK